MEIRILHRQGRSIHAIARELAISRGTVRRYLREPGLKSCYGPRVPRASKLDPFKDYLHQRIRDAAPRRLPATVYLREIRGLGYGGGVTILKDWLLAQRPIVVAPAIIRFETPPGKQAQVDWTSIRRGRNKLSAFVCTLGFSRFTFVWFASNERFETLVDAHERFFDAISGTPQTILYDNMKTVLIDRNVYGPGKHRFHAGFREFAKHHGFSPRMCAPYRPQTKGKVERFNRYLKESFVWPLESKLKPQGLILDAATANAQVGIWLRDIANPRIHGETKERPMDRLAQERDYLLPRAPCWSEEGIAIPADLQAITVPQHDLAIYDMINNWDGRVS